MTGRRIGAVAVTALGAALAANGDVWGQLPLGLLFAVVGVATLTEALEGGRTATSLRASVGVVAGWLVLALGARAGTLSNTRPELGPLDLRFWEAVLLDPWLTAPLVGALVLPFALGDRLVRAAIGLVAAGLFLLTLVLYGGGGFGLRFDVLLYLVAYAVGVGVGLVAYAPVLVFGSADSR